MKREIKFRGINNSGEFEYGNLVQYLGHLEGFVTAIQVLKNDLTVDHVVPVKPETVGQFTGLKDKNGVDIYEGDVYKTNNPSYLYKVVFVSGSFCGIGVNSGMAAPLAWDCNEDHDDVEEDLDFFDVVEVIGNIHQNKDLP